jgi:hypothetical protein
MAKHIWTVLCKRAITDGETNIVSLIDVIEEISIASNPPIPADKWSAIPFEVVVISLLERSNQDVLEQCELKVEIVSPSGETHPNRMFASIDLTKTLRVRRLFRINGLPLYGFGAHRFVVSMRKSDDDPWSRVAELPLDYKRLDDSELLAAVKSLPASAEPATTKTKSQKKKRR